MTRDGHPARAPAVGGCWLAILVSPRSAGKSVAAREDLVAGLGPHQGLGLHVTERPELEDGDFQCAGAAMNATAELLLGQQRKPVFDEG